MKLFFESILLAAFLFYLLRGFAELVAATILRKTFYFIHFIIPACLFGIVWAIHFS